MNILARVRSVKGHLAGVNHVSGAGGYVINKLERYGASAGFGYIKGAYRERAMVRGVPVDVIAGVGLTLTAAVLEAWTGGRSKLASHLDAVGDAGVMSFFNSMGAAWGAKSSGRKVYVLDAGAKPPSPLPAGLTAVGAIPPAVGGTTLSPEEIANFAAQR